MYYVQFYSRDSKGELYEALGDRAVVILDGRESKQKLVNFCHKECVKRKYKAWHIFKGKSFTDSSPVTGLFVL